MKCGKCHQDHDTVDEVKKCYGVGETSKHIPLTTVHDDRNGQYEFLQRLLAERGMEALPPYEEVKDLISKRAAASRIDFLIKNVPSRPTPPKQIRDSADKWAEIPEAHYATHDPEAKGEIDFWQVDKPTDGKWAGYIFVKRILGGHEPIKIGGAQKVAALQAIREAGPVQAMALYGQKIRKCGSCHHSLTKRASRELGIGPDCAERHGLGAEWARLDAEFGGQ